MLLIAVFTLSLAFALCDHSYNNILFSPERRPLPEPARPILRTTTEKAEQRPLIPNLAVVDKDKIQEFFNRWYSFLKTKDIDTLMTLYSEDLIFISPGNDATNKQDIYESFIQVFSAGHLLCKNPASVISGDYYYPFFWGHCYRRDDYERLMDNFVYTNILRVKEEGDYEIVLVNFHKVPNENQPQCQLNGYGEALQQPANNVQQLPTVVKQSKYKKSQPLPHSIPLQKPEKTKQIRQQLNGYGQVSQKINSHGKAPQETINPAPQQSNDQASQQTNEYDQAPQQSNGYGHAPQQTHDQAPEHYGPQQTNEYDQAPQQSNS